MATTTQVRIKLAAGTKVWRMGRNYWSTLSSPTTARATLNAGGMYVFSLGNDLHKVAPANVTVVTR